MPSCVLALVAVEERGALVLPQAQAALRHASPHGSWRGRGAIEEAPPRGRRRVARRPHLDGGAALVLEPVLDDFKPQSRLPRPSERPNIIR